MSNPFRKARALTDKQLGAALTDHQKHLAQLWQWALRRETTLRLQRWINVGLLLMIVWLFMMVQG